MAICSASSKPLVRKKKQQVPDEAVAVLNDRSQQTVASIGWGTRQRHIQHECVLEAAALRLLRDTKRDERCEGLECDRNEWMIGPDDRDLL